MGLSRKIQVRKFEAGSNGLGVFLPGEVSRAVNVWRRRYDPTVDILHPHITLAYHPFIPPEEWDKRRESVAASLSAFRPFQVTLHDVQTFLGNPHILWLEPDDGGVLAAIRDSLERNFPEAVPPLPFSFTPHVTIGLFEDEAELRQAQAAVRAELQPVSFEVNEIAYVVHEEGGLWQVRDRIPLDGRVKDQSLGAE